MYRYLGIRSKFNFLMVVSLLFPTVLFAQNTVNKSQSYTINSNSNLKVEGSSVTTYLGLANNVGNTDFANINIKKFCEDNLSSGDLGFNWAIQKNNPDFPKELKELEGSPDGDKIIFAKLLEQKKFRYLKIGNGAWGGSLYPNAESRLYNHQVWFYKNAGEDVPRDSTTEDRNEDILKFLESLPHPKYLSSESRMLPGGPEATDVYAKHWYSD